MIAIVEKLDLPTVEGEDYWKLRDTNSHCGDAVKLKASNNNNNNNNILYLKKVYSISFH
jgi:hypothetical protein